MQQDSFNILYEDKDIIVCTKSHGIPVQSRRIGTPDMESMLKTHISCQKKQEPVPSHSRGRDPYLAVIHRLDQPVSGILVFAKTKKSAASLSSQMTGGSFGKYYRALVDGFPPAPSGTLQDYLVKDGRTNTSQICSPGTPGAKKAVLEYHTVQEGSSFFPDAGSRQTELSIHLLTGRHHQIRVQLAHMGCPIAGDTKYNSSSAASGSWQVLKLCAFRLEFLHPSSGKQMQFCLEKDI